MQQTVSTSRSSSITSMSAIRDAMTASLCHALLQIGVGHASGTGIAIPATGESAIYMIQVLERNRFAAIPVATWNSGVSISTIWRLVACCGEFNG
jgi:hypothetical protein